MKYLKEYKLFEHSIVKGVPFVNRGDEFIVKKGGYRDEAFFELTKTLKNPSDTIDVPIGELIEIDNECCYPYVRVFFIYDGKRGFIETSLKSLLDAGVLIKVGTPD